MRQQGLHPNHKRDHKNKSVHLVVVQLASLILTITSPSNLRDNYSLGHLLQGKTVEIAELLRGIRQKYT